MGQLYNYRINLLNDLFVELMLSTEDISKKESKEEIEILLIKFLLQYINAKELELFDFDIKKSKLGIKVIAKNFATALVFNGIIPDNFNFINSQETLEINNFIYSFDQRKNVLLRVKK